MEMGRLIGRSSWGFACNDREWRRGILEGRQAWRWGIYGACGVMVSMRYHVDSRFQGTNLPRASCSGGFEVMFFSR